MAPHFLYEVFQTLTVSVLVAGCTLYCLLMLAPDGLKRPLKLALLRCPLPAFISARLKQTTAASPCGNGCNGCAASTSAPASAGAQTIKWHPRKL